MKSSFTKKPVVALGLLLAVVFSACTDRSITPAPTNGKVTFSFHNVVGSDEVVLDNKWYQNDFGDSFTIISFKYYISNIKLTDTKGNVYKEANSYHLIDQENSSSHSFSVANVPPGQYTHISYMIGVDSLRNVSGAQTGALDPINGMYWGWNTGYIMFSLIGTSPQSTDTFGFIAYDIGGYKGPNCVLQTLSLDLPQQITVSGTATPKINFTSDIYSFFKAPTKVSFAAMPVVNEEGPNGKLISENYAKMFSITYSGN